MNVGQKVRISESHLAFKPGESGVVEACRNVGLSERTESIEYLVRVGYSSCWIHERYLEEYRYESQRD